MQSTMAVESHSIMSKLQDALKDNIQGIFWLSSAPLKRRPYPFDYLNYFFGGIMAQNALTVKEEFGNTNIFFSKSFDSTFFLVKIQTQDIHNKQILDNIFSIIEGIKRPEDSILVLEGNQTESLEYLSKELPQYNFIPLKI